MQQVSAYPSVPLSVPLRLLEMWGGGNALAWGDMSPHNGVWAEPQPQTKFRAFWLKFDRFRDFRAHRHWNTEMCFFLSVIVHLCPVGLVSRRVNIVAERLDGSRHCLAKFFYKIADSLPRSLRLEPHQPHGWSGPDSFEPRIPSVLLSRQPERRSLTFLSFCCSVFVEVLCDDLSYDAVWREIVSFTDHVMCWRICRVQRPLVVVVVVVVFYVSVVVVAASCFTFYAAVP